MGGLIIGLIVWVVKRKPHLKPKVDKILNKKGPASKKLFKKVRPHLKKELRREQEEEVREQTERFTEELDEYVDRARTQGNDLNPREPPDGDPGRHMQDEHLLTEMIANLWFFR